MIPAFILGFFKYHPIYIPSKYTLLSSTFFNRPNV